MKTRYLLVIEDAGENLCAYFPDVPGCITTGDTLAEVRRNAQEALELHLGELEELPRASSLEEIQSNADIELDGSESFTWVEYEAQPALAC